MLVKLAMQAQTEGPPVPVTVAIDGKPVSRVDVGRQPQVVDVMYDGPARGNSSLPLQLILAPDDVWHVGVVGVSMQPLIRGSSLWSMTARGIAGAWRLAIAWLFELGGVAAFFFLLLFPGWFVLDALRMKLAAPLRESTAMLSLPATLVLIGVLTIALQAARARSDVFLLAALLLYAIPVAVVAASPERRQRARQQWRDARLFLLLPALVAVCAICYASVGLPSLDAASNWTRFAFRGVHELPIDNAASWLASETWRAHLAPNTLFSFPWRIGDRGPLLAVAHLFLSSAFEFNSPSYAHYTRLGIVLNALFLFPLAVWLSAMLGPRKGWLCAALVGLNPWVFLNVYYTWPKLFGVYFLTAAVWLLWRHSIPKTATVWTASGVLMGLSALSHTGALLSVPIILLVTLAGFARSRRSVLSMALAPLAIVAVMAPWNTYKRWHSPESYSLLYSNFLDNSGYFTPLKDNVARFFREHPRGEQIAVRSGHLRNLWLEPLRDGVIVDFWRGRDAGRRLYSNEFFAPWFSAGMIWFVGIIVALPIVLLRRGYSGLAAGNPNVPLWPAAVFALAGLTMNAALRWRAPLSHELPYFEIVLLAVVMVAVFARLGTAWLLLPLAVVVARQGYYFLESARVSRVNLPALDDYGRLYWLTLAAILVTGFLLERSRSMISSASAR